MKSIIPMLCSVFVFGCANSMNNEIIDLIDANDKSTHSTFSSHGDHENNDVIKRSVSMSNMHLQRKNELSDIPLVEDYSSESYSHFTDFPGLSDSNHPAVLTYDDIASENVLFAQRGHRRANSQFSSGQIFSIPRSTSMNNIQSYEKNLPLINRNKREISASTSYFTGELAGQFKPDSPLMFARDDRTSEGVLYSQDVSSNDIMYIMSHQNVARILSVDGGGIRGIIPARWCAMLEERTQKPISDSFHELAGTSTGGIITAGLSVPNPDQPNMPLYTASDILGIYMNRGSEIFRKRSAANNIFGISNSKYRNTPAYQLYSEYFSDVKLSDLRNDVLITYYDMTNCRPRFFKSHKARNLAYSSSSDYYLRDVIASTTAAPTYFNPHKLRTAFNIDNKINSYTKAIDGGMSANDPSGCALTEATVIYPKADAYLLLTMGTGKFRESINPKSLLSWASGAPNLLMDGATDMIQHMVKQMGSVMNKKLIYARVQVDLPKEHSAMDNLDSDNLAYLYQKAETNEAANSKLEHIIPALNLEKTSRNLLVEHNPPLPSGSGLLSSMSSLIEI